MDQAPASRGTQDITVVWVVFVLVVIGLILAYWFVLYKPKSEEIAATQMSIESKKSTLENYKQEASQLLNYEDQFAALTHQWNQNQKFFIHGLVWDQGSQAYQPEYSGANYQYATFETLKQVWAAAAFAGVAMTEMYISEDLDFYTDDEPFEIPDELKGGVGWNLVMQTRGENTNPLFTSHNFAVKFFGDLDHTKRFIEILQKLEGRVTKIFTVHCFETAEEAGYSADVVGFGDVVLTNISLEMDMFLSVYELNPSASSVNTPPDMPGGASCSYGSSGGGGSGGSGGGSGGRSGAGAGIGI
ncbi:MAG TPA: hypothetical protein VGB30_10485 [bacterium]|jgi:uncharacterized membrane protein YgcG